MSANIWWNVLMSSNNDAARFNSTIYRRKEAALTVVKLN